MPDELTKSSCPALHKRNILLQQYCNHATCRYVGSGHPPIPADKRRPARMARLLLFTTVMETIAVTTWNGIISPVFDTAGTLLIVREDGSRAVECIESLGLNARIELLQSRGVRRLICGAIVTTTRQQMERGGITVVPWVCGAVEGAIAACRRGSVLAGPFLMPGCRRQGHAGMRIADYGPENAGCGRRRCHRHGRSPNKVVEQPKRQEASE